MLIIDDILLSPFRSLVWVFRQIQNAAEEEIASQKERITAELSELYMMLDNGKITEEQFEAREQELLNRLDELEEYEESRMEDVDEDEEAA